MRRIKMAIGRIARAELQAVVAIQFLPLNALAVNKRSVLTSLVDDVKLRLLPGR